MTWFYAFISTLCPKSDNFYVRFGLLLFCRAWADVAGANIIFTPLSVSEQGIMLTMIIGFLTVLFSQMRKDIVILRQFLALSDARCETIAWSTSLHEFVQQSVSKHHDFKFLQVLFVLFQFFQNLNIVTIFFFRMRGCDFHLAKHCFLFNLC